MTQQSVPPHWEFPLLPTTSERVIFLDEHQTDLVRWQKVRTRDGSPSILLSENAAPQKTEMMHNSMGAFSETLFVYGAALKGATDLGLPRHFTSVGLGLGYVELMIIAYFLSLNEKKNWDDFSIESYETQDILIMYFNAFFNNQHVPDFFSNIYHEIVELYSDYFCISVDIIMQATQILLQSKRMRLNGEFIKSSSQKQGSSVLFFDAFSSVMSPELWQASTLKSALAGSDCSLFATYASKTEVKRQLELQGFKYFARPGFSGKREATLAYKPCKVVPSVKTKRL